ncbi:MAG: MFS transporter [Bdellovibrionia bacterium]
MDKLALEPNDPNGYTNQMIQKWRVLAAVACGTFMATLDSSIVNIALPTLTKTLSSDLLRMKWVILVYLFVLTCLLLPLGRLSDHFGRKVVYQSGFFIFIFGSGLCGTSPSLTWLVVCRGLQAVGASMLMANGPAIITSEFSPRERGSALGILAMVVSVGLVSGPSIGGFLISQLGWRSIFLINIPIGIFGIVLVQYFVRKDERTSKKLFFDWTGAIVQTCLLLAFMVSFDPPHISFSGSTPIQIPRLIMVGLVFLLTLILVRVENEAEMPLLDLSLLRNQTFWSANLAGFFTFVAFSSVQVLMPFFLEEVLHFPPNKAGMFMTAIPLTIFVIAPLSGRLSDRVGSQGLSFAGTLIGVIGLFSMAGAFGMGIHRNTEYYLIILGLISIGLATGLFQSPNNSAIMGCVPVQKLGVASALLATIRNLGLVAGTGLSTSLFTWKLKDSGDFVAAFHTTLLTAGFVAMGATMASLAKRNTPQAVINFNDLETQGKGINS